jgi:hypothetical protein
MEKEFVPYELALELKELGFDEPCLKYYVKQKLNTDYSHSILKLKQENFINGECLSPLYQQAFRWFREKYNISYSIDWMSRSLEFYNGYYVHFRGINGNKINQENFIVLNDELPPKGYGVYKTYEEAELECLKKLIQIVGEKVASTENKEYL